MLLKVRHAVGFGPDENNSNLPARQVLLEFKPLIEGYQYVKPTRRQANQFAVFLASQTSFRNSLAIMRS